jgi:hypothetical protein
MYKKDIPLKEALQILRQCHGVLLEDRFIEPSLFDLEGDPDNVWMSLHWFQEHHEEEEGEVVFVIVTFIEDDNKKVILDGCTMTVVNTDGEEEVLTLLKEWYPGQD